MREFEEILTEYIEVKASYAEQYLSPEVYNHKTVKDREMELMTKPVGQLYERLSKELDYRLRHG